MSKQLKNIFAAAAALIFSENKSLETIHVTSDGQGFTDPEKAKDQARYLKDKTVKSFDRGFESTYEDDKPEVKTGDDLSEREQLLVRYNELFGKPANHNTGVEKLKAQIAEKEKELEAANAVPGKEQA